MKVREEGTRLDAKTIWNQEDTQELMDRFCKIHHVYGIELKDSNQTALELSEQLKDWNYIGKYATEQVCRELLQQIQEFGLEEIIEVELPVPHIKICAVVVCTEEKVVATWVVGAILRDKTPQDMESSQIGMTTTQEQFTDTLEFMYLMFHRYFTMRLEEMSAGAETQKSRQAEKRMEEALRRSEAMTAMVQMLESEQEFPVVIEQIFQNVGQYLDLGSAQLIQINQTEETASIIGEWSQENVISQKNKIQNKSIKEYPFLNGKPYLISANTPLTMGFRTYFQEEHITAGMFFPIEIGGKAAMYLCFLEYTALREWKISEIKFAHDVKRVIQSILAKRITKNSLAGSYASLEEILDNMGCGICVCALDENKVFFTNQKFRGLFRKTMMEGNTERILSESMEQREDNCNREIYIEDEDKWFDIHRTEIVWVDGKNVALYTIYDITENKRYQQRIEKQANNDFLTGLYNRMRCEQDLEEFIGQTKGTNGEGALLYMDLDDFKHINDGLGHQYGDVLLKAISHSLQRIAGIENTCYRMGGDEFIIIVSNHSYWRLEHIIQEILDIFSKPWYLKGADYYCTVSMGIVRFPSNGEDVQELIRKADLALYEAKKCGKNRYEFYETNVDSSSIKRLDLEKNMRNATMNACDEFEVYYQPIMDVSKPGNPCTGAEALIRWNCEKLGFISPTEFIPLAEYLGLINPIGDYVLLEACRHCKYWNDFGHPEYKVNVNLSVVQLLRNDIAQRVQEVLEETNIDPHNLTLEVTESLAINDMARMKLILGQIKSLGVRVALDDFGTGYSSLNHIREMPIDVIKIDRCFIVDLGEDEYANAFVKIVCELAATIGMNVCVEGVEQARQYEILKEMQIQMIQGFYFDKPMTLEAFEKKYI
ncbi:MAG: EAL domain-containing protein [Lachnospiraceae bacterium]